MTKRVSVHLTYYEARDTDIWQVTKQIGTLDLPTPVVLHRLACHVNGEQLLDMQLDTAYYSSDETEEDE